MYVMYVCTHYQPVYTGTTNTREFYLNTYYRIHFFTTGNTTRYRLQVYYMYPGTGFSITPRGIFQQGGFLKLKYVAHVCVRFLHTHTHVYHCIYIIL